MPRPGEPLEDEEVDEIIESFAKHETKKAVDEELDYSYGAISKYVDKALEEGDPRLEHCDGWVDPEEQDDGWVGAGAGGSPFSPNDPADVPNWTHHAPGEFLTEFFADFEVGLKDRWVEIQARRANRRDRLPSKDSLKADILNMNSGIGQSNNIEASYIADEYWAAAQEYLKQTGRQINHQPLSGQQPTHHPGFVGQPNYDAGMGGGVGAGMGGGVGAGMGGGQFEMFQMLRDEIARLRQQVDGGGRGGDPNEAGKSTLDRLEELRREKELLNELSGADEYVERLEQKMANLEARLAEEAQAGGVPVGTGEGSLEERMLMLAATRDDIDLDRVMDALDKMEGGHKPPEILRLEREMDLKEMELEGEEARTEKFGELLEKGLEKVGEGFGKAVTSGNGGDGDSQDEATAADEATDEQQASAAVQPATDGSGASAPGAPPDATVPVEAASPTCPHCGAEMKRGPNSAVCPECEHGIAPCDICTSPVEIPPIGKADYGRCAECDAIVAVPDDEDGEARCVDCGWGGDGDALRGEFLQCESCDSFRPIQRREQLEAQAEAVDEFLGGD